MMPMGRAGHASSQLDTTRNVGSNAATFFAIAIASLTSANHATAVDKAGLSSAALGGSTSKSSASYQRHGEAGDISSERLGKAGLQFVAAGSRVSGGLR